MKNRCKICGNAVEEEELVVCKDCRDMAKTYENARGIGRSWQEKISLNGFWTFCFTQEEIDDILYGAFARMTEEEQKKLISEYCEEDVLYFVRWLTRHAK